MRRKLAFASLAGTAALASFLALKPSLLTADPDKKDLAEAAPASRSAPQLPISRCSLFSSGVGVFTPHGHQTVCEQTGLGPNNHPVDHRAGVVEAATGDSVDEGPAVYNGNECRSPPCHALQSHTTNRLRMPSTPGKAVAPGTPVVTRTGIWLSLIHHRKYSPLTQKQLGRSQAEYGLSHGSPESGPGLLLSRLPVRGADSSRTGEGGDAAWLAGT